MLKSDNKTQAKGGLGFTSALKPAPPDLEEKQRLILQAYDTSPSKQGVVEVRPDDLVVLVCNQAAAELFGHAHAADLEGRPASSLDMAEQLFDAWLESCLDCWRSQAPIGFQYTDPSTDPPRRLSFEVAPLAADHRQEAGSWRCSFRIDDLGEGVRPSALPEPPATVDARFRHIADSAPVLLWTCDEHGERDYFNRSWLELTGRSRRQEIGQGWRQGVHPEDLDGCVEEFLNAFLCREPFSIRYRLRSRDGSYRHVIDSGSPRRRSDGRFLGYVGCCVDATDRQQAEKRLRLSERWYRELIESTDNLVLQIDAEGRLIFVNPVSRAVYGAEPEECVGFPFLDFVHPDDRDETRRRFERWQLGGYGCVSFENRQTSRSGEVRDVLWNVNPHYDAEGRLVSVNCIGQDITERKRSERVHKIQSQVLESMTEGVVLSNSHGFILYTNPAQDDMFGYEPGELIGQHLEVLAGTPETGSLRQVRRALEDEGTWSGEFRHRRKDGSEIITLVRANTIEIDHTSHWVSVFEDVTARRRSEH